MLPSSLVPQADVLDDVLATVEAVSRGQTTYQDIAATIGKVDRQGRYYRLAAESLDLLLPTQQNHSVLSARGVAFVSARTNAARREIVDEALMANPVVRGVLDYIRGAGGAGRSHKQIEDWIEDHTSAGGTTPRRRASTVSAWLSSAGLVTSTATGLQAVASRIPLGVDAPIVADPRAPLIPPPGMVPMSAAGSPPIADIPDQEVAYLVNRAKLERANRTHEDLVRRMAQRAKSAGYSCSRNALIDLFASSSSDSVLFEVKSNNPTNTRSQIRAAVSQLYEYDYLHALTGAKLAVVLQAKPTGRDEWLVDYLLDSRSIYPVWDAGVAFSGPPATLYALPWL